MSLTKEQEALVIATIEHYNANVANKTLREMLSDDLTMALADGMIRESANRNGITVTHEMAIIATEALGIGIWLAEMGKTKLLDKGGLQ